jgi:hypothetical protein
MWTAFLWLIVAVCTASIVQQIVFSPGPAGTRSAGATPAPQPGASVGERWQALPAPAAVQPLAAPPALTTRDRTLGLVQRFQLDDKLAARLDVRWERFLFSWAASQDAPGAPLHLQQVPPSLIDAARARDIQPVGLLLATPPWAAANAADGPRSVPRNLALPWDDPNNYWGRYCEAMARTWAGRVDHWIVWNEPDIDRSDNNDYFAWGGSLDEYYQLLKVCYLAIKRGNPRATVVTAGLTHWADVVHHRPLYFEGLLQRLAADPAAKAHQHYFDVVSLHLYSDPHDLYSIPRQYRELLRRYGVGEKPIWVNESNVAPFDDPIFRSTPYARPTDLRCTLADQANYVLQAVALGLAGGVERLELYKAVDSPRAEGDLSAMERAGLVREDGSTRPAFTAYQVAQHYLTEPSKVSRDVHGDLESVVLTRAGGRQTVVLWSMGSRSIRAQMQASRPKAELVDASGSVKELIRQADGQYHLQLPPATCRTDPARRDRVVVGGPTLLVVE